MKSPTPPPPFPAADHDHQVCIRQAMKQAERYCGDQGLRLTDLRHRVLELIWTNHQPVGAYRLLELLNGEGRKAAPPTVYRSLEFLLAHGLIHRIASLNAYVGCSQPGRDHEAQFFICETCGQAAEINDARVETAIERDAERIGFTVGRRTVEVAGVCAHCKKRPC